MSDSIVSTKKIPIATRDFCVLSDSEKCSEIDNYKRFGFLPHNTFFFCVYDDTGLNAESFPPNCVVIYDLSLKNGCYISASDFVGAVNPCDEGDLIDEWKNNQGIYFCIRSIPVDANDYHNEVIYVGKANNILQRFSQHHKKKSFEFLGCDQIIFITYNPDYYTESDVLWAERQYIDMLKPVLNDRNDAPLFDVDTEENDSNDKTQSFVPTPKIDLEDWISDQLLDDVDWQKVRSKIVEKAPKNAVWEQAYNEGLKHGFESAKSQMINLFDSAIQPPNVTGVNTNSDNTTAAFSSLTAPLTAIVEYAKRKDEFISARQVQSGIAIFKSAKAPEIREYFKYLATLGYGVIRGAGDNLEFLSSAPDPLNLSEKIVAFLDGRDWVRDHYIKQSIRSLKVANTPIENIQTCLQHLQLQGFVEIRNAGRNGIEARKIYCDTAA